MASERLENTSASTPKEAAAGYDEYRESFLLDGRILDVGITATID